MAEICLCAWVRESVCVWTEYVCMSVEEINQDLVVYELMSSHSPGQVVVT